VDDSIVMTTQYIGLASGTVCKTRLQHITKLFIQVQLISKVTQQMQLQQTEKKQRTLSVQQAAATREREEYNHKTEHVMT